MKVVLGLGNPGPEYDATRHNVGWLVLDAMAQNCADAVSAQWVRADGPYLESRIRLRNATPNDHNLHFHGRHSPVHDGWEPVPPGGEVAKPNGKLVPVS